MKTTFLCFSPVDIWTPTLPLCLVFITVCPVVHSADRGGPQQAGSLVCIPMVSLSLARALFFSLSVSLSLARALALHHVFIISLKADSRPT